MASTLDLAAAEELFRKPPDEVVEVEGDAGMAVRRVGSGPDVLFVHGWPMSGATWRTLLPHLVDHVTCHVVDLPGAGSSRFHRGSTISLRTHVASLRRLAERTGLDDVAVVGHDSGGMMARHAFAGDPRVRSFGLVATEQPQGLSWRFRAFLLPAMATPRFGDVLGWVAGRPRLRANPFVLGDSFQDRSLLDGTFDEFGLAPLRDDAEKRWAAGQAISSFDTAMIHELGEVHARIDVPVQLVWGEHDPFFPVAWAREMLDTFAGDARLHVVPDAKLFVHEERPAEVAEALLPTLVGSA